MDFENDPVGYALHDFEKGIKPVSIQVTSDLCDDDQIDVSYLFRTIDAMPDLEKSALSFCRGKILDVGACGGCHSMILSKKFLTHSIDVSAGAVKLLKEKGLKAEQKTIFDLETETYDTILLLMNGIGLAETIENLPLFLNQLKKILHPNGKIICDSTDLSYLYEQEDGSILINLNDRYYGEINFKMSYKNVESGWFSWLYIDFDNLSEIAERSGLKCTLLFEGENNHYLVSLEHQ